jgi:hypothetical protein
MKVHLLLSLVLLLFCGADQAVFAQRAHLVGSLNNRLIDGCGCYFSFKKANRKSGGLIFAEYHGGPTDEAWMNIDGRDVKSTVVRKVDPKGRFRIGNRFITKYAAGDIVVDMVKLVTSGSGETVTILSGGYSC